MRATLRFLFVLACFVSATALGFAVLDVIRATEFERQLDGLWARSFVRFFVPALIVAGGTLGVIGWSLKRPIGSLATWVKELRSDTMTGFTRLPAAGLLKPLLDEISQLARSYHTAKVEAAQEARLRDDAEAVWTPQRLTQHCRVKMEGHPLLVVSNREPYIHVRHGREVRCVVPASGVVTALEPILQACGGTWVAHGSGNADRDVVDRHDRLAVPPTDPSYTLRRVWLEPEEEAGFYYGFANEGLWPLCHIAHTRPIFRPSDWAAYRDVNERFCEAVVEEIATTANPCVLIQDYHFTLLPQMLKARRPDARVAIFWHIPWPNAEAFGICPWQRELLEGMLGADVIGFHTPHHCRNFLETVDRALEARLDWERLDVNRGRATTHVRPFPISVALTDRNGHNAAAEHGTNGHGVDALPGVRRRPRFLAIGVDRLDYTKGIPERFRAIERFLERYPRYQGEFTCVEIGAPSRTSIPKYQELEHEVAAEAERINRRFMTSTWQPIVLLARHHEHAEIEPYYRLADVCLVTSLHDGMNLVAKEFVAARTDDGGVLVLSQFAGAAHELRDALIVNPYDVDQVAEAIRRAIEMDPGEQRARMRRMRSTVVEHNVYRWAAELIRELTNVPRDVAEAAAPFVADDPLSLYPIEDDGPPLSVLGHDVQEAVR
jgi:alpha,alpha-trehalose-phosphate synthase [UDP-forming]